MIVTDFIQFVKELDRRLKKLEVNSIIRSLKIPDDGSFVVPVATSDPASPATGQIYFNSVSGKFRGYNGATWVDFN